MSRQTYPAKFAYKGEVAERYLERRTRASKWRREQKVIERLVAGLPRGSSILDVPLGTGRFLPYYGKAHHTAYGLDISSAMLSQARDLKRTVNNVRGLIRGEAESIPLRDGAVDYVICMRLLNWTPLPVFSDIISEFKRISREGIVVQVRVTRPIGLLGMIQKTAADPWTNGHRLIQTLGTRLITALKAVSRSSATKSLVPDRSKNPGGDDAAGYFLHKAEDVARMLAAQGLVVREVIEVDKGMDYRRRQFRPLLVMSCSKGPG